jgi:hypothetical protein
MPENWKCLYFEGQTRKFRIGEVSEDITIENLDWVYGEEIYRLGHGVRPPQDGGTMPVFVFDDDNKEQVRKMQNIVREFAHTGEVTIN